MIGAGTFINPIIRIVTTVAILGAVYLFLVKPALDTTEEISDSFNTSGIEETIRDAFDSSPGGEPNIDIQIPDSAKRAQKLGDCVTAAGTDIDRIKRCMRRFSP